MPPDKKPRLREVKGLTQGLTAGGWRSSPARRFPQALSAAVAPAPAVRMSPLGPRGPGAGTRQVVEAGSWGARQSWGYLPLFSLSRAAGELEAGGDYVKVRAWAGRHGSRVLRACFMKGRILL